MESVHLFSKYAICYAIFFLLIYISKLNKGHKLFDKTGITHNRGILFGLHIAGILWLGIIPVTIIHHSFTDIVLGKQLPALHQDLTIVFLFLIYLIAAATLSEKSLATITSNSAPVFTNRFIYRYCILRIIFLSGYEIFFRGYLLTDSIEAFGIGWAIVLNVCAYALLHVFAGKKEFLACIPFGVFLCAICIWVNAAWPAILIHAATAITYEYKLAIKFSKPINEII